MRRAGRHWLKYCVWAGGCLTPPGNVLVNVVPVLCVVLGGGLLNCMKMRSKVKPYPFSYESTQALLSLVSLESGD